MEKAFDKTEEVIHLTCFTFVCNYGRVVVEAKIKVACGPEKADNDEAREVLGSIWRQRVQDSRFKMGSIW